MLTFVARWGVTGPGAAQPITDLHLVEGAGGSSLVATTRLDGQIASWRLTDAGGSPVAQIAHGGAALAGFAPAIASVPAGGQSWIFTGGGSASTLSLRPFDPGTGQFSAPLQNLRPSQLPSELVALQAVSLSAGQTLLVGGLSRHDGLGWVTLRPDGRVLAAGVVPDSAQTLAASVTVLRAVQSGGQSIVVAASGGENGLTAFAVDGAGALAPLGSLGAAQGLWISNPTAMDVATLAGRSFWCWAPQAASRSAWWSLPRAGPCP